MKLLANENFPLKSVNLIREAGFDILAISSYFSGILDSEVMKIAIDENRLILTFDRDYGELVFKKGYKPSAGIIYFRWDSFFPEEPGEYFIKLCNESKMQFNNMLTVISKDNIRQRKY